MIRGPFEFGRREPPRGPAPEMDAAPGQVLHIHSDHGDGLQFACGAAGLQAVTHGHRDAREGEQVTCARCIKLLARIRTFYTFSGKRRAEPAAKDWR